MIKTKNLIPVDEMSILQFFYMTIILSVLVEENLSTYYPTAIFCLIMNYNFKL